MPLFTQVNDTTYEVELFGKDKVEVGDKEAVDFKPCIKLNRWDEECSIDLGLDTVRKILPTVQPDKIIWDDDKSACEFIPQPPSKKDKLGGFKFNIILKKKPKTNVSVLKFKAEGLKFYYQRALTPEEIADGDVRPDNVIGSYAVYHATRTNMHASKAEAEKYKCGKAFHWYRPLIWDSSTPRKEVWGELNVDAEKGIRTVTIPQEFLDSAVYPVTIDDDFGYTTEGGTNHALYWDTIYGCQYAGAEGTGISITWNLKQYSTHTPTMKFGLYDAEDTFVENGSTGEWTLTSGWDDEKTLDFITPPSLTAQNYRIALWFNTGNYQAYSYYDDGETDQMESFGRSYDGWYTPINWTGSSWDRKETVYCTYTPGNGNILVTPNVIAQTLTEYASILKEVTTPTTLSLVDTQFIPILKFGIIPSTASLATTHYIPIIDVTTGVSITVTPATLALIAAGYIPVLTIRMRRTAHEDFWDWFYEPPVRVTITPLPDEIQFEEKK